jgi:transposase
MPKDLIDDELWSLIEPLLPQRSPRNRFGAGRLPIPDRAVLTGIVFVLSSDIGWNSLPRRLGCGSGSVCWRRLVAWRDAGVWQSIRETLLTELSRRGRLELVRVLSDSMAVRIVSDGRKPARPRAAASAAARKRLSKAKKKA